MAVASSFAESGHDLVELSVLVCVMCAWPLCVAFPVRFVFYQYILAWDLKNNNIQLFPRLKQIDLNDRYRVPS